MSSYGSRYNKATIDWARMDREFDMIPSDFRSPRFDSLKHVIEILNSVDPKYAVQDLKDARERLEKQIDEVVDIYHNGFNLAIQNYSQILSCFSESRDQVDGIRAALSDSKRRLGNQNRALITHWQKNVKLESINQILADIQSLIDIPEKIDAFQNKRDWLSAVTLLSEGLSKIGRDELSNVKALKKIKDDLSTRWKVLQNQIMAEIEKRIYEDDLIMEEESSEMFSFSPKKKYGNYNSNINNASLKYDSCNLDNDGYQVGSSSSQNTLMNYSSGIRRKYSSKQKNNTDKDSDAIVVHTLRDLIDCVSQMGSITQLKDTTSKSLKSKIRSIIVVEMQRVRDEKATQKSLSSFAHQISPSASSPNLSIPPAIAAVSKHLLECVCKKLSVVFRNLLKLFECISKVDANSDSAGVGFLKKYFTEQTQQHVGRLMSMTADEFLKQEDIKYATGNHYLDCACLDAWHCIQDQMVCLIAEMLNVTLKPIQQKHQSDSLVQIWLSRLDSDKNGEKGKSKDRSMDERKSKLSFSFGFDQDRDEKALYIGDRRVASKEETSMAKLLKKILDHPGGTYLAPMIYKRISLFQEECCTVVIDLLKFCKLNLDESLFHKNQHSLVKGFIENFVMETFLPQVWVDFRGRLTSALEDSECFRPQIKMRAMRFDSELLNNSDKSESVLKVAIFAEKMINEVCDWMEAMPPFSSSLIGVIENILLRVQESISSNINKALSDSLCSKLAFNPDLAFLMAQESDASLLSDAMAFMIVTSNETADYPSMSSCYSPATAGSIESDLAENEVIKAVINEYPIAYESILARPGNFSRMVQVAALCDSLEYISNCIDGLDILHDLPTSPFNNNNNNNINANANTNAVAPMDKSKTKRVKHGSFHLQQIIDIVPVGISTIIDKYKSLEGICVRALRLEMIILSVYHINELRTISHMCEELDRREIPPTIGALIRQAARVEEELAPNLNEKKKHYILNILPNVCMKSMMWLLPYIKEINHSGIERLNSIVSFMQPSILALIQSQTQSISSTGFKMFDHAHAFISMLSLNTDDLVAAVRDRPSRFLLSEWKSLLEIYIPGRRVFDEHFQYVDKFTKKTMTIRMNKMQALNFRKSRSFKS